MKIHVVTALHGEVETVDADYAKLEYGGCLVLRNYRTTPNDYPETVKMYSQGGWLSCEPEKAPPQ